MAEKSSTTAPKTPASQSGRDGLWRLTRPLRFFARVVRHGLPVEDRQRIAQALRHHYHQLPLPIAAKRILSNTYHGFLRRIARRIHTDPLPPIKFEAPAIKPCAQQPALPDYIIWGVIDWHFRHQRPQQLALALAATGRRVMYISSALVDQSHPGFECEPLDEECKLFQVKLYAPGAPSIYSTIPGPDLTRQLRGSVGELLLWAGSRAVVSLIQHPFWANVGSVLPNSRVVYDCMDHHEGFGNTAPELAALERGLLSGAHLTVTTSAWLDEIVSRHSTRHVLIRNACEYEHFAAAHPEPYRDSQGRQIIGYYGAIADWFDLDLVEAIASRFNTCCVLLVGADTVQARQKLSGCRNVVFTGEVPYAALPFYLHAFDICILPFKVLPLTLATNPVKVYEYLSAGKSIVSVKLPEMQQFGDLVSVAPDTPSFLSAVERALADPLSAGDMSKRQTFARGQTWGHRTQALIEAVESSAQDPKVSVIVVTYNNIDLTKACLESLEQFSDYPSLEIVVVDNASSDGSQEFLRVWASKSANRRLIANPDNKGFAAANNQGIALATGDYLVLLNNDTYVTQGWVRTLMAHLQRDRTIGLIGPVTNNIGNEARIQVTYSDMAEMRKIAARYTLSHVGENFQTRTAAFFCAMMARNVYQEVGPLDEAFGIGFFEDDDYCRRVAQLGLRIVCAEDVFIHHFLSASFGKLRSEERRAQFERNLEIYEEKWGKWIPHAHRLERTDLRGS